MLKSQIKHNLILVVIILSVILFLGLRQFYLVYVEASLNKDGQNGNIALETIALIESNDQLTKQLMDLTEYNESLLQANEDQNLQNQALQDELQNYKIVIGDVAVNGSGLNIKFTQPMHRNQIIDLLNSIKNIGADAISINGSRINDMFYVSEDVWQPPIEILVIGDSELLYSSLTRSGGIMQQLGVGEVSKQAEIIIENVK